MSRLPGRPRAVFDCNILIQAVVFGSGPAAACLQIVERGQVELLLSKMTLAELRRVLAYREVLEITPELTLVRIASFVERLTFRATLIRRVRHMFDYPRDPDDEPYIDLAIAGRADYLVSRDKDLLSLVTGHSPICRQFRQMTRPLRVVDPPTFISIIGT